MILRREYIFLHQNPASGMYCMYIHIIMYCTTDQPFVASLVSPSFVLCAVANKHKRWLETWIVANVSRGVVANKGGPSPINASSDYPVRGEVASAELKINLWSLIGRV